MHLIDRHEVVVDEVTVFGYRLPYVHALLVSGLEATHREGACVRLRSGTWHGWGDAAPLAGFSVESLMDVARELVRLNEVLPMDGAQLLARARTPCARFAVDTALHELAARRADEPLLVPRGRLMRCSIPLSELSGDVVRPRHSESLEARLSRRGIVKFKVGGRDPLADAARVRTALTNFTGETRVRLDANRRWSFEEATAFLNEVRDLPIDYIEEPTRDARDSERVALLGFPVALDETVAALSSHARGGDLLKAALERVPSASVIIAKPALIGAWHESLALAKATQDGGLHFVVSSAYESGVGWRAAVAIAAQMEQIEPAGLETYTRLAEDVLVPRPLFESGSIDVERVCSLDSVVDSSKLVPWR